jgi:hypothetical protein
MKIKISKYKNQLPTKREICSHYGQIYENIKNIKGYINVLTKKYIIDNLI